LFELWARTQEFQPLILEHILHDSLHYLEQQIEALRELIKGRDKALKVSNDNEELLVPGALIKAGGDIQHLVGLCSDDRRRPNWRES